jgi:hypothetical protein
MARRKSAQQKNTYNPNISIQLPFETAVEGILATRLIVPPVDKVRPSKDEKTGAPGKPIT